MFLVEHTYIFVMANYFFVPFLAVQLSKLRIFIVGDVGTFKTVTESSIASLSVHLRQITQSNAQ